MPFFRTHLKTAHGFSSLRPKCERSGEVYGPRTQATEVPRRGLKVEANTPTCPPSVRPFHHLQTRPTDLVPKYTSTPGRTAIGRSPTSLSRHRLPFVRLIFADTHATTRAFNGTLHPASPTPPQNPSAWPGALPSSIAPRMFRPNDLASQDALNRQDRSRPGLK